MLRAGEGEAGRSGMVTSRHRSHTFSLRPRRRDREERVCEGLRAARAEHTVSGVTLPKSTPRSSPFTGGMTVGLVPLCLSFSFCKMGITPVPTYNFLPHSSYA